MDHPMSLPVSTAQVHQAIADFTAAYDHAMSKDKAAYAMALGNLLLLLRSIEKTGLTDGGRKKLLTGIAICNEMLGAA